MRKKIKEGGEGGRDDFTAGLKGGKQRERWSRCKAKKVSLGVERKAELAGRRGTRPLTCIMES